MGGGLKNPEVIYIDRPEEGRKQEPGAPVQPTLKGAFLNWWNYRKQVWAGKKLAIAMANGTAPHGRTVVPEVGYGQASGEFGGAVIKAMTKLEVRHFKPDGTEVLEDYREVYNRVVTDAGRDAIVDAFTGAFTLSSFNFHDCGTGTGNEAVTDTALGTACGTARIEGTQSQPSSDVYKSAATWTSNNTYAVTEHGLFSASTNGTLLDRTKFAAVNVATSDTITFNFTLTIASGG